MSDEEQNLPETYEGVPQSRAEIAYRMKMQGLSLTDIAEELRVEPQTVQLILKERFKYEASFLSDDDREGLLMMENARLDHMLSKLWPSIDYGDIKAIQAALKITELRMKVNQLDLPSSTNTQQVLVIGGSSESYVEKLKAMDDG